MNEAGEGGETRKTNTGTSNPPQGSLDDSPASTHRRSVDISQYDSNMQGYPTLEQSISYFSLSSQSSTALTPSPVASGKKSFDNSLAVTPSADSIPEGLSTIESSASKIPPLPARKDSDDFSLSKIKPVHNFFGQHPSYPYDSDGSDGSLVFSPGSIIEDHKTPNFPVDNNNSKSSTMGKRLDSATSLASRSRFGSVDSVASNGSIRYVRSSPQQPSMTSDMKQGTAPINPQMLPYNERRKLNQQKQNAQQQQYQQYHAAMMQAHSLASSPQQGHSPNLPPYQMDPRMVASYYQMYGMPPPGMYAPMPPPPPPPPGQQGSMPPMNGYPYFPPPGMPYYAMPNPASGTASDGQTNLHPSVQQFQPHDSGAGGYQHQPYPAHPSMPPQYAYYQPPQPPPQPPNLTPPNLRKSPEPPQQREKQTRQPPQHKQQEPQKKPQSRSASPSGNSSSHSVSSASKNTNAKPRLPPTATRRGSGTKIIFNRDSGNSGLPPPPPLPSSKSNELSLYNSRADSYESMSTLESQSGSFSKDENDDVPSSNKNATFNPRDSPVPSAPKPTIDKIMDTPETKAQGGHSRMNTPEMPQEGLVRKNSFLDMLRKNWSPKSQSSAVVIGENGVEEFHRKNQAFLKRTLPPKQQASSPIINTMHHRRVGSEDRPPASRGTHRRLPSISNDEWEEGDGDQSSDNDTDEAQIADPSDIEIKQASTISSTYRSMEASDELDDAGIFTDEDRFTSDDGLNDYYENANETSALLPPSGISSNEKDGKNQKYDRKSRRSRQQYDATSSSRRKEHKRSHSNDFNHILSDLKTAESSRSAISTSKKSERTERWDNRTSSSARKARKKKYRYKSSKYASSGTGSSSESQDSSDGDFDHRKWTKKRSRMLEKERAKLIAQWKAEAREEAELLRKQEEANRWYRRLHRHISEQIRQFGVKTFRFLTLIESFIGNLPLTIGAVALAIVTLGVVWFKFAEEYLDTCQRVHFHSSQCTFPEFPGCFYCDKSAMGYRIAITFHFTCKITAGFLAMLLVAKILLATRVVIDEMSSPTTSSPAGLLCMTAVCVFAGRGLVGQIIVSTAACVHLALAIWFIYMALAYNIMPEPSWFPNTVGIGLSAVKTWLYYPMPGHLLMAISLSLNFFFFPISLIRVVVNKKISATVGWMQTSAPAVSLYALTIMAQPSFEEEQPDVTNFQRVHRMVYLPCMHVMCGLSLLGMAASLQSLYDRWGDFKQKPFSPAHAAFCFPTLSHANAIQSYRGAVLSFSQVPPRSWRMFILDAYWIVVLIGGTISTFWICGKFLYMLPEWTSPDVSDEEEPPAPYETLLSQQQMVTAGDSLTQNFVSPAILQANETGALILSRSARDGTLRYVRTRRIRALGFEPTMNWSEIQEEEEKLLEWVGKHPPRRRHRTLSVPGIDFNYGSSFSPVAFGTGNSGVYGTYSPAINERKRSLSSGAFFK